MRLLPLDRFQGALLGVYLGETLVNSPIAPKPSPRATPRTRFLCLALENAVSCGKASSTDDRLFRAIGPEITAEEALLFALLSEILAGYECPEFWRERAAEFGKAWSLSSEAIADGTIWGEAISLLLREKTPPDRLIPTLGAIVPPLETRLWQQLEQVRQDRGSDRPHGSTARQRDRGGSAIGTAIATSLHAFLQTPSDFRLSLRIADRVPCQRPLPVILTGLWSGLYNGIAGLPIAWRWRGQTEPFWTEMEGRARELHGIWSGVDPKRGVSLSPSIAIAAAGTIQPRKGFQPISQKDFSDFPQAHRSPDPL